MARSHRGSSVGRTRGVGDWIVDRAGKRTYTIWNFHSGQFCYRIGRRAGCTPEKSCDSSVCYRLHAAVYLPEKPFCRRSRNEIWCKILILRAKLSHENRRPLTRRSVAVCAADFEGLLGSWEPKQGGINQRDTNEVQGRTEASGRRPRSAPLSATAVPSNPQNIAVFTWLDKIVVLNTKLFRLETQT